MGFRILGKLRRRGTAHRTYFGAQAPVAPEFNGVGKPFHIGYSHHDLPGAGANQWSYDRLALSTYSPAGLGIPNGANDPALPKEDVINGGQIVFAPSMRPVANVMQGAVLYMLGDPGTPTGYFVLQPLTDTSPSDPAYQLLGMQQLAAEQADLPSSTVD